MPVHTVMPADRAPARKAILGGAWLGILTWVIPPGLADEVTAGIAEAAKKLPPEKRPRQRILTPRVTLYFVLGLCLFSGTAYDGVFRQVTAGLGVLAPATRALTAARARLGSEPARALFLLLCSALTPREETWSHVCGLLLAAWDGTTLALADTGANAAVFGRPGAGGKKKPGQQKGPPPAPAARVVMLIACGTRTVLGAAAGPFRGKDTGERELARGLLGCLHAGMLLLADKGFYSYALWQEAAGTGAGLLWRAKDSMHLPVIRELPDGSFLAHVNSPAAVKSRGHKNKKRRCRGNLPPDTSPVAGITVRVIEYVLTVTEDDGTTRTSRYRLLTTLLDHRAYPAADLAAAYARRWAAETGYLEIKTCLLGSGRALRGKTPDLACQEIWALLAVYQAIRTLIILTAARDGLDPARISFTTTLEAIRRTAGGSRGHRQLAAARDTAETEMLAVLIPERGHRTCPRAVKRVPYAPWPVKKPGQEPVSQHATCTATITPPGQTTQNSPDQQQQPPTSDTTPP